MLVATVVAAVVLLPVGARGPGSFCPCGSCNSSSVATYRLADTFKERVDKKYACFWPQSIACDYVKSKRSSRDLSALLAAVQRHEAKQQAVDRPAPTDVVWHLRLGDTSGCERPFYNHACAEKESHGRTKVDVHSQYFFQKDYFQAAVSRFSKDLRHVTFVFSTTHVKCQTAKRNHGTTELPEGFVDRSLEYVRDASEFLRKRNYTVSERRDHHPDDDLAYMCGADVLVLGGGGFTLLAAMCALHRDPAARVYGSALAQKSFLAEVAHEAGLAERALVRGSGIIDVFTGAKERTKAPPGRKR